MVPGKSRNRKHLGTSAGLLPGDFLARFVLGTENPGTTRYNSLPVNYQGHGAGVVPGKSRNSKHLGTSAGLLPGNLLARFVLGTEIPGTTRYNSLHNDFFSSATEQNQQLPKHVPRE